MPPRRAHKKSRNGCESCKRRHVKCDESRPICANCQTSELRCSYLEQPGGAQLASAPGFSSQPSIASTPNASSPESYTLLPSSSEDQFRANMLHFELLQHFRTAVLSIGPSILGDKTDMVEVALKYAVSAPYLLHEILAISALHLSTLKLDERSFYRQQSTGLQNTALSLVKHPLSDAKSQNPVALFLFASFVGMHALGDTVLSHDNSSFRFIESFASYMNLHRGVASIVSDSWDVIRESELRQLIVSSEAHFAKEKSSNHECSRLHSLLTSSDLTQSTIDAYAKAIEILQVAFDIDGSIQIGQHSTNLIFSWPIRVPPEFNGLLTQKQPEAMVIVAYFAVLLHRHRWAWLIGPAGRHLVDSIAHYLGAYWDPFLEWPKTQVLVQDMDEQMT